PLTVRIELSAPYAPLVAVLSDRAGMIISPKALTQYGDKIADHLTCAGPYRFVERVAQGRIVAERFKDYWNAGAYTIDRVTYTPVTDQTVRLDNLRAGQFDIIEGLAATDVKTVEADPKLQFLEATGLAYEMMSINVNNGPDADNPLGKDPRVREALELSLDRKAINDGCSRVSSCRQTSPKRPVANIGTRPARCPRATSPRPKAFWRPPARRTRPLPSPPPTTRSTNNSLRSSRRWQARPGSRSSFRRSRRRRWSRTTMPAITRPASRSGAAGPTPTATSASGSPATGFSTGAST